MSLKLALVMLPAAFGLAAGASIAYAAVVGPDGTIHGCYSNLSNNGSHFLFVTDTTCPADSTALNWNQTGPQGPAGSQGPPGPGPTTYIRLHTIQAGMGTLYEVFCDVNPGTNQRDTATGGGANYVAHGEAVGISGSYPIVGQATAMEPGP